MVMVLVIVMVDVIVMDIANISVIVNVSVISTLSRCKNIQYMQNYMRNFPKKCGENPKNVSTPFLINLFHHHRTT